MASKLSPYHRNNPTVAFRIPLKDYAILQQAVNAGLAANKNTLLNQLVLEGLYSPKFQQRLIEAQAQQNPAASDRDSAVWKKV